jgi:hypothetical protein
MKVKTPKELQYSLDELSKEKQSLLDVFYAKISIDDLDETICVSLKHCDGKVTGVKCTAHRGLMDLHGSSGDNLQYCSDATIALFAHVRTQAVRWYHQEDDQYVEFPTQKNMRPIIDRIKKEFLNN